MPSERKLWKKLKNIEEMLSRNRRRSRSRSRSPLRLRLDPSPRTPSADPQDVEHDQVAEDDVVVVDEQPINTISQEQLPLEAGEDVPQGDDPIASFREALGTEYDECIKKFEGKIQDGISKRWNHILINGLTKEEKDSILKKYKLPENCQLLDAPILNEEVKAVLTESSKIRDRSLETVQHQLGVATAIVGQVMSDIMEHNEVDKIALVTKLGEATKLLNDIHFQKTRTRRLLISPLLDKNFNDLVDKVKRDENLYGMELAMKIKCNQELKKSSSQIKKVVNKPTGTKVNIKPIATVGNRYGPPLTQPRQQFRVTAPRGGPKSHVVVPPQQRPGPTQSRSERATPRGARNRR